MGFETIKIKKYSDIVIERDANAAIIPGSLVELISTNKVQKHATAAGKHSFMFALEDELQGKGINDNYAAGDKVQVWVAGRGDIVNALLQDEANITIGTYLESAGEGRLKAFGSGVIVGVAVEAKDLSTFPEGSDSSAGGQYYNPRIKVQII